MSGQKLSSHLDKSIQTGHIIDVGWFDTQFFFFTRGFYAQKHEQLFYP